MIEKLANDSIFDSEMMKNDTKVKRITKENKTKTHSADIESTASWWQCSADSIHMTMHNNDLSIESTNLVD